MKISFAQVPTKGRCPLCGAPMVERVARRGPYAGQTFEGCARWPDCGHIVTHEIVDQDFRGAFDRSDRFDGGEAHDLFPYREDWGW